MCKFCITLCTILFINLTLLSSTFAADDTEKKCKVIEKYGSRRLKKYLFCDYRGWLLRSPNPDNVTKVFVGLDPLLASFDEEEGTLKLRSYTYTYWHDPLLAWNPKDYDNITSVVIKSHQIWNPDIGVLSAGNEYSKNFGIPWNSRCGLWNRGIIVCSPVMTYTIKCQTDFTQWPFDRQNCTLVFSTWLRPNEIIQFYKDKGQTVDMTYFHSNQEWRMIVSRVFFDERNSTFAKRQGDILPRVSIDFILDRAHNHLSGRFVSPAIILMVLTLVTLWLKPGSTERLSVACINVIIHLYCMQDVHWNIPHNGTTIPNLLLFYVNSLVLATIALILTFLLGSLQKIKIDPPQWISSSTASILRSNVGQILLLSMLDPKVAAEIEPDADDSGILITSKTKPKAWGYLSIMLGWITFIVFFFTYIIMAAVLIPNSSMRPPLINLGSLT